MSKGSETKSIERGKRLFRVMLVSVLTLLIGSGFTLDYANQALAKQAATIPVARPRPNHTSTS
jgi:hypothetical protein